ncbi:MAG: septum formation initiator family protein [Chitinophagales bacterium]|nr:septum formation initiator family protein [Chitinophagales bacterium]
MKNLAKKMWPILNNKYIFCSLAFATWMLFFDKNDVVSQVQLKRQLAKLHEEKTYLQQQIVEVEQTAKALNNPGSLEQFAREQYLMKKDNEDLFVIVKTPAK